MLEKFTVIDLIKTRSASVVTFTGNIVKFNIQTAQELGYPPFVQLLIDQKGKQFAVRVCKEDAPNAVSFSKPMGDQKYQIKINNIAVVDLVRKTMAGTPRITGMSPAFILPPSRQSSTALRLPMLRRRKVAGPRSTRRKLPLLPPKPPSRRLWRSKEQLNGAGDGDFLPRHFLLPAFYKPASDVVPGQAGASLEEQVALLPVDHHGIAVTLAPGPHSRSLPDIGYPVDFIFCAVLPHDDAREHRAVLAEFHINWHIHFQVV